MQAPESPQDTSLQTTEEKDFPSEPSASQQLDSSPAPSGWRKLVDWFRTRQDPFSSLVLTLPVFLLYHLGILGIDLRNGVDFVTELTLRLLDFSVGAYAGVTLGLCVLLGLVAWWLRAKGKIRPLLFIPVFVESAIWGVLMLFTIGWATHKLFVWSGLDMDRVRGAAAHASSFSPALNTGLPQMNFLEEVVMSAGAGFHEELVFRVGLLGGFTFLFRRWTYLGNISSWWVAALLSSVCFSAIHYVGSFSDTFTLWSFGFRFLSGVYLALLYRWRGFATSVYTHFFYDVLVFSLR